MPNGKQTKVFSEAQSREMWTPAILTPTATYPGKLAAFSPKFSAYALGWSVRDYRGVKVIDHGGAVFGVQTYVVLIPEKKIGIAVQINSEDFQAMRGVAMELLDHYLGAPDTDWVGRVRRIRRQPRSRAASPHSMRQRSRAARRRARPRSPTADYAGHYNDPWYGPIEIKNEKGGLRIDFTRTPGMVGRLEHAHHDTFRAVWDDPNDRAGVRHLRPRCGGQDRPGHDEGRLADRRFQLRLPGPALHAGQEAVTLPRSGAMIGPTKGEGRRCARSDGGCPV